MKSKYVLMVVCVFSVMLISAFGVYAQDSRFSILTNLTVKDAKTGLIWTRSADIASKSMTWVSIDAFIKGLNKQKYGGYTDWRLPEVHELFSIIDTNYHKPSLTQGHPFIDVRHEYWSSSVCAYKNDNAWAVSANHGNVTVHDKNTSLHVWPVRSE
ncbi:DUF1566 domain-containing protein [Candidatus Magnetominusculus xianensis]|uniref:Lcl C-terminal domain-containing protein n=1 Tax=Candidatus Magnetominusculus xianensis TaxID=1748249 RepID=A0ABR5SIE4_9BACT|nr:DUF1566 domain-containing protein [Candidatus Magnetominusculus xianensis]KWT91033.1 hypothetical protein ASN18_0980 [Candidatus Magnetominusculus xianensis]MBF0402574.1 DUF1566 domain-containing protein [Nitrospirota bacterium]